MKNRLVSLVTMIATVIGLSVPSVVSADNPVTVGWKAEPMDSAGLMFSTEGELKCAYATQGVTINGIPFTRRIPLLASDAVALSPANYSFDGSLMNEGVAGDYGLLLGNGWYWGGDSESSRTVTLTLKDIEPGKRYLVQILSHTMWDNKLVVSAGGCTPRHVHGADEASGKYGALLTGVFTASGTTQDVTISFAESDGKHPINAIQVRELGGGGEEPVDPVDPVDPQPDYDLGWTAAAMTTDPASVRTDGVLAYAYACDGNRVVNGVEFVKLASTDTEDLAWNVSQSSSSPLPGDFSGDYGDLLKSQWWAGGDTLTLRRLVPGNDYLVQVIGCRYNHADTKRTKVTVTEANDRSIYMKAAGDDEWVYGGTLVGRFTAAAEAQTFHFEKFDGSWSAFNAVQVRDLSLSEDDAVAVIVRGATTNHFFTVDDAYRAAESGETVCLVKDADFPGNEPVFSKLVDIDLNGHVLTRDNLIREKTVTSDTVISNGVITFDTGVYSADLRVPFKVQDGATLTLDAVGVGDSAGHEPLCLMSLAGGSRSVLSGKGIYHVGSLFKSVDDTNKMTIRGGRYILRGWFMPASATSQFANNRKGDLRISGGAFSIAPDPSWIESGYRILHDVSDPETPYHVVPQDEAPYTEPGWSYAYTDAAAAEAAVVAKRVTADGVKYYTSLGDAIDAANGSGTVTLVADIPSLDRGVTLGGTVTLDGDGHKVSVAHPYVNDSGYVANDFSFNVLNLITVAPSPADVTVRNISLMGGGLLDGALSNDGLQAIDNHGTLRMENVTVSRSNGAVCNRRGGVLLMDNCRLVRNCRFCAGGLFNQSGAFAVMDRSSLSENRSLGIAGGGGACENGGTLFVNNCVIANNSSTEVGGAINNYSSDDVPKLYLMNTTVAGNFSSIYEDTNALDHDKGGAIGLRGKTGAKFCAVNSLFSCNYQTDTRTGVAWGPIMASDICSIDGGTEIKLYYSTYTGARVAQMNVAGVRQIDGSVSEASVFNAYFASPRVYQNEKQTAMAIAGAQLIAKEDGSLDATLARYAPILRTDNGDGTYAYGEAVYGADGVYTYFDASEWKGKVIKMAYAEVVGTPDLGDCASAGELLPVGDLPLAIASDMVTGYYESARGRSFGVVGASGWLEEEKVLYTVKLAGEPENGTVSGVTLFGDTYEEGTKVTLSASPGYARDFLGWYEVTDGGATTNFIAGSDKTVWDLTVNRDYLLLATFSDLKDILLPEPSVHTRMADDGEDGPKLYPISVKTDWMTRHYDHFEESLDQKVREEGVEGAKAWLTTILEQIDEETGLKMWQDYVLGIEPGDKEAKIWIDSPQHMSTGKNIIRMEMNKLSPVSGSKFTISYRLDKKLGEADDFARSEVNATGVYDINVDKGDPSGLYVIDVLFVPEGKSTSEEYVTTVNTAGVLRVANNASRAALSVPWSKLTPGEPSPVSAANLVKTMNLSVGDRLYVYDRARSGYRAWELRENGLWNPLATYRIAGGYVDMINAGDPQTNSDVDRGLGIWLERADATGCVYLCGQYDAAPVTTMLSSGWNLVGAPGTGTLDLAAFPRLADGDRIVVPTAEEPLNVTYEGDAWGYLRNEKKTYKGMMVVVPTRVTDAVVPPGSAFWYISTGSDEIHW